MSLNEAPLKNVGKDEVIVLTLDYQTKINSIFMIEWQVGNANVGLITSTPNGNA